MRGFFLCIKLSFVHHLYTQTENTASKDIDRVVEVLVNNGIMAYETDLNWAFACDSKSKNASQKLLDLKPDHPKKTPFTFIFPDIAEISHYAVVENHHYRCLKKIFPGPYTIILKRGRDFPRHVDDRRKNLGVRIMEQPLIMKVLQKLGRPIISTSVPKVIQVNADNQTGVEHGIHFGYQIAEKYGHALDLIVDTGAELLNLETTVIDYTEAQPFLVRPGVGHLEIFNLA